MARYSGWGFDLPFTAGEDLSSYQWYFVKPGSTAGQVVLATGGSGPAPIGVLQNDPKSGEEATVRIFGTTKVAASAASAIGYGDFVTSNANGLAILTSASLKPVSGIALEACSSGSAIIEVLLLPGFACLADNTP